MVVIVHIYCGELHDKYEEMDFFEENDDILLLLLVASGITKKQPQGNVTIFTGKHVCVGVSVS